MSSTSSSPDPRLPSQESDTVLVGRIVRPHGLRGDVVVEVATEVAGRFAPGSELLMRLPGGVVRSVCVEDGRVSGARARLRFAGVAGREAAEGLRDATLEVSVAKVPTAPSGSFWQHELLGMRCRDAREGELGRIEELVDLGGGPLLRVSGERGEILIPFAAPFVVALDREAGLLRLDLPPGLVEACASRS